VVATGTTYDGRFGYHIPTISNGVPVEPEAVQRARAEHLAKVGAIPNHYHHLRRRDVNYYDGRFGYHIPTIHNGVPVEPEANQRARAEHLAKSVHGGAIFETPEVQHARAEHFAAIAAAQTHVHHPIEARTDDGSWYEGKYV
jgi:hypothetical protein